MQQRLQDSIGHGDPVAGASLFSIAHLQALPQVPQVVLQRLHLGKRARHVRALSRHHCLMVFELLLQLPALLPRLQRLHQFQTTPTTGACELQPELCLL